MKKATAPAMSAKPTTPPTTPPAIAPALLLCEPLLPEFKGIRPVSVGSAELEMVPVGIVDDAVTSGVSTTNFQIRRVGTF